MKCRRVRLLLPDYMADELSVDQRRLVDRHVKGCSDCGDALERLQAVWNGLARQVLPQKEEGFWREFTTDVMSQIRKQRPLRREEKGAFLPVGWRFFIPVAAMTMFIIVSVFLFSGGLRQLRGPEEKSLEILLGERETIAEAAHALSVAPVATDSLDREIGLQVAPPSTEMPGIPLNPRDMATITEVLTQLSGEEDIDETLQGLTGDEQQEFDKLLSSRYTYS
jgi:anti-sigma factor RsiW